MNRARLVRHAATILTLSIFVALGMLMNAIQPYDHQAAPAERIISWATRPAGIVMLTLIGFGALFVYVATLGRDQLQRLQQTTQPSVQEKWTIDENFTDEAVRIHSLYR